jgi:hypothetical protein
MPDLSTLDLLGNPSRQPLTYPGTLVKQSGLLAGRWLYPIIALAAQPVSSWRVERDGGPLDNSATVRLDDALTKAGSAPVSLREPVLAIGSNASPGQLLHKLGEHAVVLLTRVTVRGFTVGHSPHISKPGYVPYIPIATPGMRHDFVVAWLDSDQRERMDRTEPNYARVMVDAGEAPAILESGEPLDVYALYRGRWGALRLTPSDQPLTASRQEMVLGALGEQSWFQRLVPECSSGPLRTAEVLAANPCLRDSIKKELSHRNLVAGDRLAHVVAHDQLWSAET